MTSDAWYVVKQADGHCTIVPEGDLDQSGADQTRKADRWGPFASQGEAIARRVGLIRAGKCQPL